MAAINLTPSLLISILFLLILTAETATDPVDKAAMLTLAKSIGADKSPVLHWTDSTDPCQDWSDVSKGVLVQCESNSGKITRIQIGNSQKDLTGPLPPEIGNLTALQILEVMNLTLTGTLPSLSRLSSLQRLFLNNNNFTGMPPNFFSGLTSLTDISLDYNPFDPWPMQDSMNQCTRLVKFSALAANIVGGIPDFFSNFSSLEVLRLSNNLLIGGLPQSLSDTNLKTLWLNSQGGGGLSGGADVIANLTSLEDLALQSNTFSGPLPDFSRLVNLRSLSVRDNRFTGPVPKSLTGLGSLTEVHLSNNLLQGPTPTFGKNVAILELDKERFCHDSSEDCDSRVNILLSVVSSLGYPVPLADNWQGNDPCAGRWQGINCDAGGNVIMVNFKKMNLSGVISPDFEQLLYLQKLYLSDNRLSGTIPSGLTNLKSLQLIDVSNNDIYGPVPSFANGVSVITVGNPHINSTVPLGAPSPVLPPPGEDSDNGSRKKSKAGPIVGYVFGAIFGVGVIGLLAFCCWKKRKGKNYGKTPSIVIHPQHSGSDAETLKLTIANGNVPSIRENGGVVEAVNMAISIQLLREVTNGFSEDNILGRGGFGTVYGGELYDGTMIAVKRMESGAIGSKGSNEFKSEISVLTKVRHRHLVSLLGYCLEEDEKILVYEYMPQGTLSRYLFNWEKAGLKPLDWTRRLIIALDVGRGVEYLHSLANQTFIHRDLKPSNILLGDDLRAKVADFGLVRLAPAGGKHSVETRIAGTFGYLAPEYVQTGRVTPKADVFSFGVILMELVTGRKALDNSRSAENLHLVAWFRQMQQNMETFKEAIDPTIKIEDKETFASVLTVSELAGHCCVREPYRRPDMGHAVNILSSLAERWKPSDYDRNSDDGFGVNMDMNLKDVVRQWQDSESSQTEGGSYYGGQDNTRNSIPTLPGRIRADTYSGRE